MMNESIQESPSSLFSQQQLIEEVEKIIVLESDKTCKLWIHSSRLAELFVEKHKMSLEVVIRNQGHDTNIRRFLKSSKHFSIYGASAPQEFYLALFSSLDFIFMKERENKEKHIDQKSCELDSHLEAVSDDKSTKSQRFHQAQNTIESLNDLEVVLAKIIQQLLTSTPKEDITIVDLSREFYAYYDRPIKGVMRSICPDMRLIEVLQSVPNLHNQFYGE